MMKSNEQFAEYFVATLLIVLLILFLDPLSIGMSNSMYMMMLLAIIVVFGVFAGLIFRERARDEREALHRMVAGRNAYLAGALVIVAALVVQGFQHAVDPWLAIALVIMVGAKLVGLVRAKRQQ